MKYDFNTIITKIILEFKGYLKIPNFLNINIDFTGSKALKLDLTEDVFESILNSFMKLLNPVDLKKAWKLLKNFAEKAFNEGKVFVIKNKKYRKVSEKISKTVSTKIKQETKDIAEKAKQKAEKVKKKLKLLKKQKKKLKKRKRRKIELAKKAKEAKEEAERAAERARQAAERAAERARQAAERAAERARHVVHHAEHSVSKTVSHIEHSIWAATLVAMVKSSQGNAAARYAVIDHILIHSTSRYISRST